MCTKQYLLLFTFRASSIWGGMVLLLAVAKPHVSLHHYFTYFNFCPPPSGGAASLFSSSVCYFSFFLNECVQHYGTAIRKNSQKRAYLDFSVYLTWTTPLSRKPQHTFTKHGGTWWDWRALVRGCNHFSWACLYCRNRLCISRCFLVVFLCVCVFLCQSLVWKSAWHQCHCMLHVKAKLTHTLSFLFCCHSRPLSVLRSTPVIIAFVTATIIQICLGKLLLYTSDNFYTTHALQWHKLQPQTMCSDQMLCTEFCNWSTNSKT